MHEGPIVFDRLRSRATKIGRAIVSEHDICPPFAVLALKDGSLHSISAEGPPGTRFGDYLAALVKELRTERRKNDMLGVALCFSGGALNVETSEDVRAIIIQMEDNSGSVECVAIPFSGDIFGALRFEEPVSQPAQAKIFDRGEIRSLKALSDES